MKRTVDKKTKHRARELRQNLTVAERRLWLRFRGKQFLGLHIRKQHPIGPYIVDFFIPKVTLIIELDGDSHDTRMDKDSYRDEFMRERGFEVVRIQNEQIMRNLDGVLEYLKNYCEEKENNPL